MRRSLMWIMLGSVVACAMPVVPAVTSTAEIPAPTPTITTFLEVTATGVASPEAAVTEDGVTEGGNPLDACASPAAPASTGALPDLSQVHWANREDGSRMLLGLGYPARYLSASPNGEHLAVTLVLGSEGQTDIEATALIDTQGGDNRWLSTGSSGGEHLYRWLPDGRLLWLDGEGQFYANDRLLNAPAPMMAIDAAAGDIAFLSPDWGSWKGHDWRVDLAQRQWEALTALDGSPAGQLQGLSADKTSALLLTADNVQGGTSLTYHLWRMQVSLGSHAQPLFDIEARPVAVDGLDSVHTTNLAGTNLWDIGGMFLGLAGDQPHQSEGFLINLDTGSPMTAGDFGIAAEYTILGKHISPDGQWLAIDVTNDVRVADGSQIAAVDDVYLTSGGAAGGMLIPGYQFEGWSAHGAVLRDGESGSMAISPMPPDGSTIPLPYAARMVSIYAPWQGTPPGFVLALPEGQPGQVYRYDEQGTLLGLINLGPELNVVFPRWATHARGTIYLSAAQATVGADGCKYQPAVVAWETE